MIVVKNFSKTIKTMPEIVGYHNITGKENFLFRRLIINISNSKKTIIYFLSAISNILYLKGLFFKQKPSLRKKPWR
tara:strand:+ start:551 stop:778 length:228 start_codon:yes stop_codon:yes gene_type:complete